MPPALLAWHSRGDVLAGLALAALLYLRGWRTLRHVRGPRAAPLTELLATTLGWAVVALALLSPLDVYQPLLLSVHMVQHELLLLIAPPLVLLGRPFSKTVWGLPGPLRTRAVRALRRGAPLRRLVEACLRPQLAWLVSALLLWGWHLPAAYNAAESDGVLHNLQHLTFLASGLVFWWPLLRIPPSRWRPHLPSTALYLLLGMTHRSVLGAIFALADRAFYSHYVLVPRVVALTPLEDQHVAGAVMWFGGGVVLLASACLIIFAYPERDRPVPTASAPAVMPVLGPLSSSRAEI